MKKRYRGWGWGRGNLGLQLPRDVDLLFSPITQRAPRVSEYQAGCCDPKQRVVNFGRHLGRCCCRPPPLCPASGDNCLPSIVPISIQRPKLFAKAVCPLTKVISACADKARDLFIHSTGLLGSSLCIPLCPAMVVYSFPTRDNIFPSHLLLSVISP